jgi:hypothetical protein
MADLRLATVSTMITNQRKVSSGNCNSTEAICNEFALTLVCRQLGLTNWQTACASSGLGAERLPQLSRPTVTCCSSSLTHYCLCSSKGHALLWFGDKQEQNRSI